jgi:hypothetical protein
MAGLQDDVDVESFRKLLVAVSDRDFCDACDVCDFALGPAFTT